MPFKVTRPDININEMFKPVYDTFKKYPDLSPTSSGGSRK
jgi:hypothetical protein